MKIPINCRDFWDVPRIFIAPHRGITLLFNCPFDGVEEDYSEFYSVLLLPELSDSEIEGPWDILFQYTLRDLGLVPIHEVHLDLTQRKSVDSDFLDRLLKTRLPKSDPLGAAILEVDPLHG